MSEKDLKETLFGEFDPVSEQVWQELAIKDLKGADQFQRLTWKTPDGYEVKPYYTGSSLEGLGHLKVAPGKFPFVRGKNTRGNDWWIRQDIQVKDLSKSNKKALDILMNGVTSLGFILDPGQNPGPEMVEKLCENIYAEAVELNFMQAADPLALINGLLYLVKKYNRNLSKIKGSVEYDPIGDCFLNKNNLAGLEDSLSLARELITTSQYLTGFRVLAVNGKNFHNAGAGIVEELAFSLAQGANYLTHLTERGLTVCEIAPRIQFNFATGSSYFPEIAKLRAARLLWSAIVKAYGPSASEAAAMYIHCSSSRWNKTLYDPYVNLLRTTSESMAAIIGGADALTVLPFNTAYGNENVNAGRLARNQQLLLREESYFDKVADPGAGSYYIENLTDLIAGAAWKLFLEVHENGGFAEAVKNNFIPARITESAGRKLNAFATRKEILLGTNQYPDFNEKLDEKTLDALSGKTNDTGIRESQASMLQRGPEAFEKLRTTTDRWALKNKRPKVFTLTIGNPGMRRARSQFACNFFACGGFEVIDNTGFADASKASEACLKAKADIAVICSSDEEYEQYAPEFARLLEGKTLLVIAGNPDLLTDKAKPAAIRNFIHLKSNVLESLKNFQMELGIK
ncbi:MAG: methylmalonyl-CoA mutase small subunit [Bacteroidales bacterium]|nr:methylmalonyl-CoA mutase small subunit [Bacteroidales bacterium]